MGGWAVLLSPVLKGSAPLGETELLDAGALPFLVTGLTSVNGRNTPVAKSG